MWIEGNSFNSSRECNIGFTGPWVFMLDLLQTFKLILLWTIFNFSTFILGGQFLLPQRANMEKREFIKLQNWMRQRGLGAWGIQNGPFAAHWAHFVPEDFQLFHFHTGRPILITPRGPIMGKGNSPNFKIGWDRGFPVPGAFKLDHLHPSKPILLGQFFNFFTFILGGQFLLPQKANNGKREFTQLQKWMRQRGFSAFGI